MSPSIAGVRKRRRALTYRVLRVLPVRLHARPDFLILGAQKAGTTSLYSWLTKHPDVLPARTKELHYFDRVPASAPIRPYWANFPLAARIATLRRLRGRNVVTGEATACYLFDPRVPKMVKRGLPDVKLIILLRDPVERAISNYWMNFNKGNERLALEEALAAEQERIGPGLQRISEGEPPGAAFRYATYVSRGLYADQLERWLSEFERRQVLILDFNDLAEKPGTVYEQALRFIGVDPTVAPPPEFRAQYVGAKKSTNPDTVNWLRDQFVTSNERVAHLVGITFRYRGSQSPD